MTVSLKDQTTNYKGKIIVDKLHELQIPTVIMHGKKDKIVFYKLAEEMHTGIKGSKMLTFAGGHIFFFMKERQQFLDAIAEFVGT